MAHYIVYIGLDENGNGSSEDCSNADGNRPGVRGTGIALGWVLVLVVDVVFQEFICVAVVLLAVARRGENGQNLI